MNLTILQQRRQRLAQRFPTPVILWSGCSLSRNFEANRYPFRPSSHFLYFTGLSLENAAIRLENGNLELFIDNPTPSSTLWHGETPTREDIAITIGADAAYPLAELTSRTSQTATIAVQDLKTCQQQYQLLQRHTNDLDIALAKAIITLRLTHDTEALSEIRKAINVTIKAHLAGMEATSRAKTEADIRGAMEGVIIAQNMTCAYSSIVTVHGEILHNEHYHHSLQPRDLLLADVGAETLTGWASDITRTWPISGQFSPTQRDIYDIVLAAHDTCITKIQPGVEYRDIHLLASLVIAEGLVNLGILKGNPAHLVEIDAHALFFPHGIGHLLGLDVHDMEDLGDLAGYAEGRTRSQRFGLGYLRLDRPLQAGMIVTIEPGFYQVPAILYNWELQDKYRDVLNPEKLAQFADVKGIRIEDDVLVTETGAEVLSHQLPTQAKEIETLCN